MNIEEVLDLLDELLDKAWSFPLSGGRCVVDADRVREYIDDIRINLPGEVRQAKAIVRDRAEIIDTAHKEADAVIRKAEERAKTILAKEEIVTKAREKASEIISQTQMQAREMRSAAQTFSDDVLRSAEEVMQKSLSELRATRQAIRGRKPARPPIPREE
ncbi:MAG: ATPase [Oscillospiraceae bacterium]|jgi:cell division septum initiation protein DivIVA|nr:ATPase [Oscillospiraceae bacterium]